MPEEFKPEASVDFESWIQEAAPPNGNGGPSHVQPPPEQDRPADPPRPPVIPGPASHNSAPHGGDPLMQLEAVSRDLPLIYRELGDMNASLMRAQLTSGITLGAMLLLAVLVWKIAQPKT